MSDTLVDSSAWIDFFRGDAPAVRRVDPLLADGRAAITGPVYAEVLSGVPTRAEYQRLEVLLGALDWLKAPEDVWERAAEVRFALARGGVQAHLIDLYVAITAAHAGHRLLTRDKDFRLIARGLPIELECF